MTDTAIWTPADIRATRPANQPRPQDGVLCWRHPDKECPGDCQYLLAADKCAHERGRGRPPKKHWVVK